MSYEKTYGHFDNHTIHSRFLPAVSYEVPKGVFFLLFLFLPCLYKYVFNSLVGGELNLDSDLYDNTLCHADIFVGSVEA